LLYTDDWRPYQNLIVEMEHNRRILANFLSRKVDKLMKIVVFLAQKHIVIWLILTLVNLNTSTSLFTILNNILSASYV